MLVVMLLFRKRRQLLQLQLQLQLLLSLVKSQDFHPNPKDVFSI
jgi:hypothetical protein